MTIINDATGWSLTLELSIMLQENIYSTGITHDDRKIFIVHATAIISSTNACHFCLDTNRYLFDAVIISDTVSGYLNDTSQGKQTEGKGSVQMTSWLR